MTEPTDADFNTMNRTHISPHTAYPRNKEFKTKKHRARGVFRPATMESGRACHEAAIPDASFGTPHASEPKVLFPTPFDAGATLNSVTVNADASDSLARGAGGDPKNKPQHKEVFCKTDSPTEMSSQFAESLQALLALFHQFLPIHSVNFPGVQSSKDTPSFSSEKPAYRLVDVFIFGSTLSYGRWDGMTSDLDIAIVDHETRGVPVLLDGGGGGEERTEIERKFIEFLLSKLRSVEAPVNSGGMVLKNDKLKAIVSTRVPIVKYNGTGKRGAFPSFDIAVRFNGVRNSVLIHRYMAANAVTRMGALLLKKWAKEARLIGTGKEQLSSYGLTLMWIYFLLRAEKPACSASQAAPHSYLAQWVDPAEFQGDTFNHDGFAGVSFLDYSTDDDEVEKQLRSLFISFFDFFSEVGVNAFSFKTEIVSLTTRPGVQCSQNEIVRSGCHPWYLEDPCELSDSGGRHFLRVPQAETIVKLFNLAKSNMCTNTLSFKCTTRDKTTDKTTPIRQKECSQGEKCYRGGCPKLHPPSRSKMNCQHGANCKHRDKCPLVHP